MDKLNSNQLDSLRNQLSGLVGGSTAPGATMPGEVGEVIVDHTNHTSDGWI